MLNRLPLVLAIPACNALCVLPALPEPSRPQPSAPFVASAPSLPPLAAVRPLPVAPPPAASALLGEASSSPAAYAQPFVGAGQDGASTQRSLDCLTAAVYYEARSEPVEGQRAVAQVVLNRVRHPGFPNSVCGVVYQGSARSTGCQFTFTCDGSMLQPREPGAWARAQEIAQQALNGVIDLNVGLATSYHAESVLPWWARSLNKVATIGSQIFYSLRGALGDALAFRQPYSGVEPTSASIDMVQRPVVLSAPSRYTFADGTSVAVHRGGDAAAAASSFGVRIHSGNRPQTERSDDVAISTVKVHRGGGAPESDPS